MFRRLRPTALAGALAVLVVSLVAFVVVMSQSAPRRTATNSKLVAIALDVPPGSELCQPQLFVPGGTGAVRLRVTPRGRNNGPLLLSVRRGSTVLRSARSVTNFADSFLSTPIPRVDHLLNDVSLCIRNSGRVPVAFQGESRPGDPGDAIMDGSPAPIELRVDWYTPGPQTYWQQAGVVADRFRLQKAAWFGGWTFWAALVALLALSAAAVRLVVREPSP